MSTVFDDRRTDLEAKVQRLAQRMKGLFLLAYAQRLTLVFALFEERARKTGVTFDEVVRRLWKTAKSSPDSTIPAALDLLIPGEDWVVGGFHDAVAQYIGNLADGAFQGLSGTRAVEGNPEYAIFDLFRLILCEMRLSCTEPAEDEEGLRFERELHQEPLIVEEMRFWIDLLDVVAKSTSVAEVHHFALENILDPARFEPDLSLGLERDRLGSQLE